MTKQSSLVLIIVFCLVQILVVVTKNVGSDFGRNRRENGRNALDCSTFGRDYDILKSLPFPVLISPLVTINKTFAMMNLTNHVTELTIYKERFVPLNVYCLKNLNALTIYNTDFYEYGLDDESFRTIPREIGQLSSLRQFHVYDSPVAYLPNEFGKLSLLTSLSIINSGLKQIPSFIQNLTLLQSLKLSSNKLTSLPSTVSSLKSLMVLDLQSNPLTSIAEVNGMPSITHLYAQNCNIKYIPDNMRSLVYLNMSYNQLDDLFGVSALGNMGQWITFDFSYNKIDVIPPEISKVVSRLIFFSVQRNRLTHLPKELFSLPNMPTVVLNIKENPFPLAEINLIKETVRTRLPAIQVLY
jgi:hypothetical protein